MTSASTNPRHVVSLKTKAPPSLNYPEIRALPLASHAGVAQQYVRSLVSSKPSVKVVLGAGGGPPTLEKRHACGTPGICAPRHGSRRPACACPLVYALCVPWAVGLFASAEHPAFHPLPRGTPLAWERASCEIPPIAECPSDPHIRADHGRVGERAASKTRRGAMWASHHR
jgi:hypothetical protein